MLDEIENRFTYHAPKLGQLERYNEIRQRVRELAEYIHESCPASRERDMAVTRLEEAMMWANASIVLNE